MKKLITSAVAALALLFGFASCSGDLHDAEMPKHEPVKIDGAAWYYYDITVFGDVTEGTAKIIVNGKGSGKQSSDTPIGAWTAATGGVQYFTCNTSDKNPSNADQYVVNLSYQKDQPAYEVVPGTVRIYVYTNETSPNLYFFDADKACTAPKWPGYAMTKVGEVVKPTYNAEMTVTTVNVTGLPSDLNGKTLYMTGDFNGWATPGAAGTIEVTVKEGKIELKNQSLKFKSEGVEIGKVAKSPFKFAAKDWGLPEITATNYNNIEAFISSECNTIELTYVDCKVEKDNETGKEKGRKYGCAINVK